MKLRYRHVWTNSLHDWETVDSDICVLDCGFADCDMLKSLWDDREPSTLEQTLKKVMVYKWAFYPHRHGRDTTCVSSRYKGIEYEVVK